MCTEQLLATIQRLQSQTVTNNVQLTSQPQLQQPSVRDDFIVGHDLTSLLAASADDVQTVLKHLDSVSAVKFVQKAVSEP